MSDEKQRGEKSGDVEDISYVVFNATTTEGSNIVVLRLSQGSAQFEIPMTAREAFNLSSMIEAASRKAAGHALEPSNVH